MISALVFDEGLGDLAIGITVSVVLSLGWVCATMLGAQLAQFRHDNHFEIGCIHRRSAIESGTHSRGHRMLKVLVAHQSTLLGVRMPNARRPGAQSGVGSQFGESRCSFDSRVAGD